MLEDITVKSATMWVSPRVAVISRSLLQVIVSSILTVTTGNS